MTNRTKTFRARLKAEGVRRIDLYLTQETSDHLEAMKQHYGLPASQIIALALHKLAAESPRRFYP